jgi:hypothetical protein
MSTVNNGPQIVRSGLVLDLDASYIRSYSPNVAPNPTDIFAWCGTAGVNSCTISRDASITRQYGSTPLKMVVTGNDPYISSYANSFWNLAPAINGQTWTVSVYVKASVATTGELFVFGADSSGSYGGAGTYGNSTAINITTSWTRVSFTTTMSGANVAYIQVRLDGPNGSGAGTTIWWDGLQVERASSATTFNPYYIGNTVWKDVSGSGNSAGLYNGGGGNILIDGPTFNTSNGGNILFDGVNDYGSIANSSSLRPTNELTIEMVIKAVSTTAGWNHLFGINPYTSYSPLIFLETGGQLIRALHFVDGVEYRCNTNETISTSVFKHVVFTFKPGDAIRSYFNGVASTTASIPNGTLSYNTSNAFLIGYLGANWPNVQFGLVRMYNKALTQAEVSQNFQATKTRFGL